jgi:translocation and assembly module TamA
LRTVSLAAVVCVFAATPAMAFNLFGLRLFEGQQQADEAAVLADPQPYTIDFSTSGATGDLDAAIRNASGLLAGKDQPASGTPGLLATARSDYKRINSALYAQGHYGGTIHILIGGREATNVAPDADLPDPVAVRVIVDPGPLFHFGRLRIADRAPPTDDPADHVALP